ncbi:LysR family transcriptional regulator [Eubacterium ventriosum]|uniref:LysR family transcriptional regulator n=1 Tax=Eubacterium ventriosum TaxID=39496 RepID=UPI003F9902B1
MTLQQLKYAITVAETGTITEAANKLYISQPSLTNAIHELEKEMNIIIFNRTNKGISISKEGEDFLGYARQVLEQAAILEDKYKGDNGGKKKFCVSTQHYSFAVNAFVDLIKKFGQDEYDFSLRETQTYEIIEDVARMRSEIGILFLNDFNEKVITKILKSYDLELLENKEEVINRIHEAEKYIPLDRLYLNPQCGFASCEIGNKLTEEEQWAKLKLVKEIAEEVWG